MKLGYARASTQDQNLALQLDALKAAGCSKIIQDRGGGPQSQWIKDLTA
ncbi:recombinase family protein [Spirosoma liriopis]|nr:recombinase family protein [Spirosoma liriopis]